MLLRLYVLIYLTLFKSTTRLQAVIHISSVILSAIKLFKTLLLGEMFALPVAITFLATFIAYCLYQDYKRSKGLPPGPPALPLIGNLHQAPTEYPWKVFQQWTKQYGPIFRLKFGMQTVIVLGDHETVHDLLDKRSNIYSSRPHLPMGTDSYGKGLLTLL